MVEVIHSLDAMAWGIFNRLFREEGDFIICARSSTFWWSVLFVHLFLI